MTSASPQRRTALITGTPSGIGEALSLVFAANGFDLVLVSRNADGLHEPRSRLKRGRQIRIHVVAQRRPRASALADATRDCRTCAETSGCSIAPTARQPHVTREGARHG